MHISRQNQVIHYDLGSSYIFSCITPPFYLSIYLSSQENPAAVPKSVLSFPNTLHPQGEIGREVEKCCFVLRASQILLVICQILLVRFSKIQHFPGYMIYMPHSSTLFLVRSPFLPPVSRRYARLRLAASPARPEAAAAAGHRPEAVGAPGDISKILGINPSNLGDIPM